MQDIEKGRKEEKERYSGNGGGGREVKRRRREKHKKKNKKEKVKERTVKMDRIRRVSRCKALYRRFPTTWNVSAFYSGLMSLMSSPDFLCMRQYTTYHVEEQLN